MPGWDPMSMWNPTDYHEVRTRADDGQHAQRTAGPGVRSCGDRCAVQRVRACARLTRRCVRAFAARGISGPRLPPLPDVQRGVLPIPLPPALSCMQDRRKPLPAVRRRAGRAVRLRGVCPLHVDDSRVTVCPRKQRGLGDGASYGGKYH